MGNIINVNTDGYDDGMVDSLNNFNTSSIKNNNNVNNNNNNSNDADGYDDGNDNKTNNVAQKAFESHSSTSLSAMAHSTSSDKLELSKMNGVKAQHNETQRMEASNNLRRSKKLDYMARRQRSSSHIRSPLAKSISTEHLSNALLNVLSEKALSNAITVIQSISPDIIRQHRESNTTYVDKSLGQDRQIIIKPSGKVFLCIQTLGTGNYKVTEKGLFLGKIANYTNLVNPFADQEPKFRAFSLPIEGKEDKNSEEESVLNLRLRDLKRTNSDLSKVNVIKSVSKINADQKLVETELYDGNVNNLIVSGGLDENKRHFIAAEMAIAVKQLHVLGIVHRDLKPDNFLHKLNEQNEVVKVVITDFGFSKPVNEPDKNRNMFLPISDPTWPAQEYSEASDIYQMGMNYIHLYAGYSVEEWKGIVMTGKENLPGVDPSIPPAQKIRLWKQQPLEKWTDLKGEKIFDRIKDPAVKEFVKKMVSLNRDERPTIDEVISFFNSKI